MADLTGLVDQLSDLTLGSHNNIFLVDRESLTYTKISCNQCIDTGTITAFEALINRSLDREDHQIPCPECSPNNVAKQ